jgi:hypothetical protein
VNQWIADVDEVAAYKQDPDAWVAHTDNPSDRRAIHRRLLWSETMLADCQHYLDGRPKAVDNALYVQGPVTTEPVDEYDESRSFMQLVSENKDFGVRMAPEVYKRYCQPNDRLLAARYGLDRCVIVARQGRAVAAINYAVYFLYYKLPRQLSPPMRRRATNLYLDKLLPQIRRGLSEPGARRRQGNK